MRRMNARRRHIQSGERRREGKRSNNCCLFLAGDSFADCIVMSCFVVLISDKEWIVILAS